MANYSFDIKKDCHGIPVAVVFDGFNDEFAIDDSKEISMAFLQDLLLNAIQQRISQKKPVPYSKKSPVTERYITVSALVSIKIELWNAMLAKKIRKSDLVRAMKVKAPQVDRIFNVRHNSTIHSLCSAAEVLGLKLRLSLQVGDNRIEMF